MTALAQSEPSSRSSQSQPGADFGSKFFDNLRMLFGRLQQSELDRAFQRASAVHCTDLVGQTGDWKEGINRKASPKGGFSFCKEMTVSSS